MLALVAALFLAGCKTVPINSQTISGRYEMLGKPENQWYAGEALVLGDGTFQYWLFSDLADDPRLAKYPVSGRYTLNGSVITLHHPAVLSPERTITRIQKQFVLWTPKQRESFRDTARLPDDLLVQKIF